MNYPITLHYNMGGAQNWDNPNLYPGDENGNPVTPKAGVACHIWARVANTGSDPLQLIEVSYYVLNPAAGLVYPSVPHGSNSAPILGGKEQMLIMCSVPWIPDSNLNSHQCLVAVASCLDCPPPPSTPGTPVDASLGQVAQHNVTIFKASANSSIQRPFSITNAANDGHVEITRGELSDHAAVLQARGFNGETVEAPQAEFYLTDGNGKNLGTKFSFKKGETHNLFANVNTDQHQPGSAALYHVKQVENGKVIGGVTQIVEH